MKIAGINAIQYNNSLRSNTDTKVRYNSTPDIAPDSFEKSTPDTVTAKIAQNTKNISFGDRSVILKSALEKLPEGYHDYANKLYNISDSLRCQPEFFIMKAKELIHFTKIYGNHPSETQKILTEMKYTSPKEPVAVMKTLHPYSYAEPYTTEEVDYYDFVTPLQNHFRFYKDQLNRLNAGRNIEELLNKDVTQILQTRKECPNFSVLIDKRIYCYGGSGSEKMKFNDQQLAKMCPTFREFPSEVIIFATKEAIPSNSCWIKDIEHMCYDPDEIIKLAKIYGSNKEKVNKILEQMDLELKQTRSRIQVKWCFERAKKRILEIGDK